MHHAVAAIILRRLEGDKECIIFYLNETGCSEQIDRRNGGKKQRSEESEEAVSE